LRVALAFGAFGERFSRIYESPCKLFSNSAMGWILVHHFWLLMEQQEGGDVPAIQMTTVEVLEMHRHLASVIGAEN